MTRYSYRLLLNAEPFGFGPASAIASLVPRLKASGVQLDYIGQKHTLDLQKKLPYDAIYDTTDMSPPALEELLTQLRPEYDAFLTAMDFKMAELAKKVGFETIIFDALTWYWPNIRSTIANADLYLAQNFFGVRERLEEQSSLFPKSQLVAPLVTVKQKHSKADHVLLNLGGLQNPHWSINDTVRYARVMIETVKKAVPNEQLIIATSSTVAKEFQDAGIKTYDRQSILQILAGSKYAIMTPGLGNIYDAAAFDVPTLWLPPANDSQGQQLHLLSEHDCCDQATDWSDIGVSIDYKTAQATVLNNIARAVNRVTDYEACRHALEAMTSSKLTELTTSTGSKTTRLLELFGTDGANDICSAVMKRLESNVHAA